MSEYIITQEQMQELIERAAIEAVDGYKNGVAKQIWSFPKLPEIVRCRDCVYMNNQKYKNSLEYQTCSFFDSKYAEVEPDGFCKWGERK